VNPTQFGPKEISPNTRADLRREFETVPRRRRGVVFTPGDTESIRAEPVAADVNRRDETGFDKRGPQQPTSSRKLVTHVMKRIAANAFSRRDDGGGQAVHLRAADRTVFGAENDWQQAVIIKTHGGGFEFSGKNHRRADTARTGRAGDEFAQQISCPVIWRRQATVLWQSIQ